MNCKKVLAVVMTLMLVFVGMPFGSVVYADTASVGEVAMVLTTNGECPTGPNDPDILTGKPAVNTEFYLWVLTTTVNELVGADTWVSYDPTKLSVADMNAAIPGVQPVSIPTAANPNEVSIYQVTADTLNTVEGNLIKYAASNTSPSNFANGAVILKSKFKVLAEIPNGSGLGFERLELRGKLGLDNNPIKIIPNAIYEYVWNTTAPVVPPAPAGGTVDDVADTYTFIPNTQYPLATDYEYSLDSGATWAPCTSFVINIGNIALPREAVQVRVKANGTTPAGAAQMSDAPYTVAATAATTITVDNKVVKENGTVAVAIKATGVTGMTGATFTVQYDPTVAVVESITAGNLATGLFVPNVANASQGTVTLSFANVTAVNGNGTICTLNFKAIGAVGATTQVDVTNYLFEAGEEEIAVGIVKGEVKVISPILYGDVNGSGKVTTLDATMILQHLAGIITLTPEQLLAADTNASSKVTTLDATLILQKLAGIISVFPAEGSN